jgi:hypothetical protein
MRDQIRGKEKKSHGDTTVPLIETETHETETGEELAKRTKWRGTATASDCENKQTKLKSEEFKAIDCSYQNKDFFRKQSSNQGRRRGRKRNRVPLCSSL